MIETFAHARDAELEGRVWLGFLRRAGPAFVANSWHDLSYAAGNPVANYYASAPLVAAVLSGRDGIDTGPAPAAGMQKLLRVATLLPGATGGVRTFWFLDYCLYYPFVDGVWAGTTEPDDEVLTVDGFVAAMLTALQATAIPVDIAKVNGLDVAGAGTSGDPWGPA